MKKERIWKEYEERRQKVGFQGNIFVVQGISFMANSQTYSFISCKLSSAFSFS